ncbi:hypothetical protein ABBQ32_001603 [Trebouxia sp. C0010 RCD-2024]
MVAHDSPVPASCSGVCYYGCNSSEPFTCLCSSLDMSREMPVYVSKLAGAVQRVVQHNDAETPLAVDKPTCFHCAQNPPISIRSYIQRIAKNSKCSPVCFIMAWSYCKRLAQSHAEIALTSLTVHRVLITAVMLAAKLMDDKYYNNAFYAKIGGVSTCELNHMELEMLRMLDYRTFVSSSRVHELLGRLEVFQAPGRIVSVLCRKRLSRLPDGSSAAPVDPYKHQPKLAKGHVAKNQAANSLLPSTISGVSAQIISDQRCARIQSATPQVSRCGASADSGVVCAELSQLLVPQVGVVDVSA